MFFLHYQKVKTKMNILKKKRAFKGGLFGSDGLIIFKCLKVIFSLKKKTIQFPLLINLYFQQKRAPKLSVCHLPMKRSV